MKFTLLDGTQVNRPWGAALSGLRAARVEFTGLDFHTLQHWPGDKIKQYFLESVAPHLVEHPPKGPDPEQDLIPNKELDPGKLYDQVLADRTPADLRSRGLMALRDILDNSADGANRNAVVSLAQVLNEMDRRARTTKAPEGTEGAAQETLDGVVRDLKDAVQKNERLRRENEGLRMERDLQKRSDLDTLAQMERILRLPRQATVLQGTETGSEEDGKRLVEMLRRDRPGPLQLLPDPQPEFRQADAQALSWLRVNGKDLEWLVANMATLRTLVGTTQMATDMARHTDKEDTMAAIEASLRRPPSTKATPPHALARHIGHLADEMVGVGFGGRPRRAELAADIRRQAAKLEHTAKAYYDLN